MATSSIIIISTPSRVSVLGDLHAGLIGSSLDLYQSAHYSFFARRFYNTGKRLPRAEEVRQDLFNLCKPAEGIHSWSDTQTSWRLLQLDLRDLSAPAPRACRRKGLPYALDVQVALSTAKVSWEAGHEGLSRPDSSWKRKSMGAAYGYL